MAKTTELAPIADLEAGDLLMVVDDPTGTAVSKSATVSQLSGYRKIISEATQTATISNNDGEVTLFSQTIPANTLSIGDFVLLRSVNEVLALTSGELRQRVWLGPVGGTGLITGYFNKTSAGRTGFEFNCFSVVDTGAGPTAARLVSAGFSGVDVVADLTQTITVNWTGQMTVADPGNSYRGCSAHLLVL